MTKRALILCCLLIFGLSSIQAQSKRPNIIFIQTDDQAAWALGASGNRDARTPNLDRFFREGAYLRNAFVSTPVCSPSRAALITSRYGTELGITDWINPNIEPEVGLSPDVVTWPKLLSDAGYFNGLIGKWHLGTQDRFHPSKFGFKYFMGFRAGGVPTKDPKLEVNDEVKQVEGFTVDIVTDDAIRFLGEHRDKTFMLMLNYREPHAAYLPVRDEDWQKVAALDPQITDHPDLDVARAKKLMREYLASVAAIDRNVGRLLATVDELKLRDNTVVIFTSDHGYNIGHHGVWHKGNGHLLTRGSDAYRATDPRIQRPNVFDTSLRTPTAIRWPGFVKPGAEIKQTVTNLDWFPTLLNIAGVKLPANTLIRGRDITPLLKGRRVKWDDDLYVEWSQHHYVTTHLRMYRTPEWKLVRDFLNPGKDELYHLVVDPDENVNLITDRSAQAIKAKLEAKMMERMRANNDVLLNNLNNSAGALKQSRRDVASVRAGIGPSFKGPLGLQLYSLRAEFAKDVPGTLAKVREMGFREVEMGGTYGLTPQQFRAELDKAGLRAVSMGASFDSLRDNVDVVIQNARTFGVQYVMCGWIPHQRPFSEEAARQAIQVFNRAGEKLKAAGITFAYHIHGYEFQPYRSGTLFDLLAAELKPEFASFELDVFWAFHGGQDPVALMRKYPKRFTLMHLKDMRKGEKGDLTGNAPDDWSVALGAGQIDFPAVLREAKKIGVKWYFVEEESHTPLENIPAGLRYLEKLRF